MGNFRGLLKFDECSHSLRLYGMCCVNEKTEWADAWSRRQSAPSVSQVGRKLGINQSLVESAEGGIVPISQRPPAGNDVAILIVTDGLELPYAVNKLQVTHMLILVGQDAINAVIDPAEGQLIQGIFTIFQSAAAPL